MSFDLAVFRAREPVSDEAATRIYEALCGGAAAFDALDARERLDAFYRVLVAKYPEIDDDPDESPFACAIDRGPRGIVIAISFSRAAEVARAVETLALENELDCFDPQTRKILRASDPDARPRAAAAPKLKAKEGLDRFVRGVTPELEKRGFVPLRSKKKAWGRTRPNGVIHRIDLNLGLADAVRPEVGIGLEDALALLTHAVPGERDLPTMLLQSLHRAGRIPERPWATGQGEAELSICHPECVEKSIGDFAATLDHLAQPFFNAVATPVEIDAFFSRETQGVLGPAEPFVRVNLGLLLMLAIARVVRGAAAEATFDDARRRVALWRERKLFCYSAGLEAQIETIASADLFTPRTGKNPAKKKRT